MLISNIKKRDGRLEGVKNCVTSFMDDPLSKGRQHSNAMLYSWFTFLTESCSIVYFFYFSKFTIIGRYLCRLIRNRTLGSQCNFTNIKHAAFYLHFRIVLFRCKNVGAKAVCKCWRSWSKESNFWKINFYFFWLTLLSSCPCRVVVPEQVLSWTEMDLVSIFTNHFYDNSIIYVFLHSGKMPQTINTFRMDRARSYKTSTDLFRRLAQSI